MSWMQKLYEVYEAARQNGEVSTGGEATGQPVLLPLCHTLFNAQVEITISEGGDFLRASVIEDKERQRTLVPCTEKSASRTSGVLPMPLMDKLIYLAGDYRQHCPKGEKERAYEAFFDAYRQALLQWLPTAPPDVKAWAAYVEKRHMIGDLIACGLLPADENGVVPAKWEGTGDKPAIYRAVPNSPLDAFVRFRVSHPGGEEERVWLNPEVQNSFIAFQNSLDCRREICYVRGVEMPVSESSPKYIRYPGDGAKLVSANDKTGFTYRGRFTDVDQAMTVGRETTEKAHSALKWLIQRQGYRNGEQVVLTFATGGKRLPDLGGDTEALDLWEGDADAAAPAQPFTTRQELAKRVNQALAGYRCKLDPQDEAVVIGLDSATPGRLSIFYYREMRAEDFLGRVCRWHTTCAWTHAYRYVQDGADDRGKAKFRRVTFVGAPAPSDIVKAAYGENLSDKLLKSGVERLLPCIADGAHVPPDMVRCAARRAARRAGLSDWEADKALSIACALIRKQLNDRAKKEEWDMALQPEVNDRSYLFGRALAFAEHIEQYALQRAGEKRTTNAERLMVAFAKHPAKSWMTLMERLQPYLQRLGTWANALEEGMEEVISRLNMEGFTNEPLNERYLLGYACQKQAFALQRAENTEKKNAAEAKED